MASRVLLLMAERGVGDSPLWLRGSDEGAGQADAADLRLSAELRRDLREWNAVFFDVDGIAEQEPSGDAFDLAARVQLELGDDTHVWCGNAGHLGMATDTTTMLVVAASAVGSTVERRSRRGVEPVTVGALRARDDTPRAIVRWRGFTTRIGAPFGNAQTRSEGLRAAGALQRDVGDAAEVVFFGGARSPRDSAVASAQDQ